jgi:hypothetical protein
LRIKALSPTSKKWNTPGRSVICREIAMADEAAIRESFRRQAVWCDRMGSPFTAHLCRTLADHLAETSEIGDLILHWEGSPDPVSDALALRVCGALHALVLGHRADLANLYPPNPEPSAERLWRIAEKAMIEEPELFKEYLASPPQTNEVGRCNALLPGMLVIAKRFGLPLKIFEIGSSAGLNLFPDRFGYDFDGARWGDIASKVQLKPDWRGAAPPVDASLSILLRHGVDQAPIDIRSQAAQNRLLSYVWAGQPERLVRLRGAIGIAVDEEAHVEKADAAAWLDRMIAITPEMGFTRVIYHSVVWQYLSPATTAQLRARLEAAGANATRQAPIAWLRLEKMENGQGHSLDLTTWPNGRSERLATAHAHGAWVEWLMH